MKDYEHRHQQQHHRHKRAEKSVCYGELGCFEDSGPFGYLDMLPQSPEEIGTKFYFYSTANRSDRALLEIPYLNMSRMFYELDNDGTDNNSTDTRFFAGNASEPLTPELKRNVAALKSFNGFDTMSVRVIVHGFGAACHHVWIYEMRTALMAVVSQLFSLIFLGQFYDNSYTIICWLMFSSPFGLIYRRIVLWFVWIGKPVQVYQTMYEPVRIHV